MFITSKSTNAAEVNLFDEIHSKSFSMQLNFMRLESLHPQISQRGKAATKLKPRVGTGEHGFFAANECKATNTCSPRMHRFAALHSFVAIPFSTNQLQMF